MRMLFFRSLRKGLPALLTALALSACGPSNSQDGVVEFQGSVVISPTALDINLADPAGLAVCAPGSAQAIFPVIVSVFDGRGFPRGNADITLQLDFSPSTIYVPFPVTAPMSLLDSSGTVLLTVAPPFAGGSAFYTTQTDDDGTKRFQLLLDISIACSYAGSLTVDSGTIVTSMQVTAVGS